MKTIISTIFGSTQHFIASRMISAKEQGTGLGLMLCKEFLKKNESELRIESTPGKGSIFSFRLPVANNEEL